MPLSRHNRGAPRAIANKAACKNKTLTMQARLGEKIGRQDFFQS
jgi:hypothetical protein